MRRIIVGAVALLLGGGTAFGPSATTRLSATTGLSAAAGAPGFARGSASAVRARGYIPRARGEPKARPLAGQTALPQKSEIVDCVAAVVNGRPITLVDVRIADVFGLVDAGPSPAPEARRRAILERLIDRKVVIDLTQERAPVDQEKVAQEIGRLLSRLGRDAAKDRLASFGLAAEDLRPYIEEAVLRETIVTGRFVNAATVSLQEIETYYAGTFVPAQTKLGRTPPLMIDVLDSLEAEIKAVKIESQIALWIKNLRQQADIDIRPDCLNK
jgi:hypothetical protein